MGTATIQSQVVFANPSEAVTEQLVRAFQGQVTCLCDLQEGLERGVFIDARQILTKDLWPPLRGAHGHRKVTLVRGFDSSMQIIHMSQGVNDLTTGDWTVYHQVFSSRGLNMGAARSQRRKKYWYNSLDKFLSSWLQSNSQ